MNKTATISILVLAFIGGFLFFYKPNPISTPTQNNSEIIGTQQKWESKTDDQANVTVVVTPLNISFDSKEWTFDVVMNTHSVELGQDMKEITVLTDDSGKEYGAVRWEGPEPGGHHREGIVVFNAISPMPSHLELKIKNIGEIPERSFKWDLE